MIFVLTIMLFVTNLLQALPPSPLNHFEHGNPEGYDGADLAFIIWLRIEFVNVVGLTISNVIFMMIRSCLRHKVTTTSKLSSQ